MEVNILEFPVPDQNVATETLKLEIKGVNNAFANALRRVMLSEIPTLAVDYVKVKRNTSVLPDEMLAHRIALLPLWSMKAREMRFERDCTCDRLGCSHCQITGRLKVRCPDTEHRIDVYADAETLQLDDPAVYPVSSTEKGVWLVTLGRSQELDVEVAIRKGIGKLHAKYMPVSTVAMQFAPEIIINGSGLAKLPTERRAQWVARCPRGVFEMDDVEGRVRIAKQEECIFCRECVSTEPPFDRLPEPLAVVRQKKTTVGNSTVYDFTFVIESTGVLPVTQILFDAIHVLNRKLGVVQKGLLDGTDRSELVPKRAIGGAPTAPQVVNEDVVDRVDAEDNLRFLMR